MKVELPQHMYDKDAPRPPFNAVPPLLLLAVLAVFCIWQLAGLPGTLLKKFAPPADMPWSGRGFRLVYIDKDGDWVLNRVGYADRMMRYEVSPNGTLTRFADQSFEGSTTDISGIPHGGTPVLSWGAKVKVKGSAAFHLWTQRVKRAAHMDYGPPLPEPSADSAVEGGAASGAQAQQAETQDSTGAPLEPGLSLTRHLPWYVQLADQMMQDHASAVPIDVYLNLAATPAEREHTVALLIGHHYFPVFDSWALVEPYLWLSTDRLKYLHKVHVTQAGDDAVLIPEKSVPLDLGVQVDRSTVMGVDPERKLLFILLATGDRFWFDPQTLDPAGHDKLPGDWRYEYGEIMDGPRYSLYRGLPLSEGGYQRIMGGLMLVLLAALIGLTLLGRHIWKSTSATTTAASSSSASLPSTLQDSDIP